MNRLTWRRARGPAFAALLLWAVFPAPPAHAAPQSFPWHLPEWKSRQVVELIASDPEGRLNTGLILLDARPPQIAPDGRDLRLLDENGLPVKFHLVDEASRPLTGAPPPNLPFRIHFQVASAAVRFYLVYFGNPAAPAVSDTWEEKLGGLTLETRVNTSRRAAGSWKDMMDLIAQSKWKFGQGTRRQINDSENPFGPNEQFLSLYRGSIACPTDGEYVFGTDSDDSSFLLIDGQVVADWPGSHLGVGNFSHSGKVRLQGGVHKIEYYHVQAGGSTPLARAGWQPPGTDHIVTIPEEAFVRELRTEAWSVDERDNPLSVCFKPKVVDSYQFGSSGPVMVLMSFDDLSRSALGDVAVREWDFGDGVVSLDENPRHVFAGGKTYSVRLRCMDNLGFEGTYTGEVIAGSGASTRVGVAMEVSTDKALLLPDEAPAVTLKCKLDTAVSEDLPVSLAATFTGTDGVVLKRDCEPLTAAPGAWQTLQHSLAGESWRGRVGEVLFQIQTMGVPVAEAKLLIRDACDSRLRLSLDKDQITDDGRPVALRLSGEAYPRRTPSFLDKLSSGAEARVVVVDDSLAGDGPTGYPEQLPEQLRRRFPGAKVRVSRVGLASGSRSYQAMRGLVEFPEKVRDERPDAVVVAASLRDVLRFAPVERFERTLQGLVDRIQALSGAQVILVAPPPTIANPGMAEAYAVGVKRIGLRRDLPVADACGAFMKAAADSGFASSPTSAPAWGEFYKDPDSSVPIYHVSPVARGQEIIAAVVARALLEK